MIGTTKRTSRNPDAQGKRVVFTSPEKSDRPHGCRRWAELLVLIWLFTPTPALAQTPATATLAAPTGLTEANLTGPAITVTVTVANTAYENPLTAAHFMLSDTVPGVVSISGGDSGVARDSPTQATLTLTHDGTDITMAGALTVTVQDAGHTGTGDLPTATVPITAGAGMNICGRTAQVRDAILARISFFSAATCGDVAASDLAGITQLNLVGDGISTLQNGDFSGLSALTTLFLRFNSLSTLPENVFNGLSALTGLQLSNNNLSPLPANVFNGLSALEDLDLDSNSLITLPANVFNGLSALADLDLGSNSLSTLPDNVFNGLSALEDLNLRSNSLSTLPDNVFNGLSALEDLNLDFNSLNTLPDNVFNGLSALEELDLSFNSLSTLPENVFNGLSALVDLDLFSNSLSTLPANVFNGLSALTSLDLGGNSLSPLPENVFNGLSALEELSLAGNSLSTLPENVFNGLSALEELNLSINSLNTLPENVFNGLSALTSLDLNFNSLSTLPENVFNGLSALTFLNLSINSLNTLPENIFNGLSALTSLDLNFNSLNTLPDNVFNGLSALEDLDLNGNTFTPGTGLPAGVFDDVLDTLGSIGARFSSASFIVDANVRDAHFVCSLPDAMLVVDATAGVDDCLLISSEQLTAFAMTDTTLSALTISAVALIPAFDPTIDAYTVAVQNSVANISITPTANQPTATITVQDVAVTSGSASAALPLTASTPLDIAIEVTAPDGTTMATYTVTVSRPASGGATAALSGTITEANLSAGTAMATMTLTGTEFVAAADLMPNDFAISDAIDGDVSITGVTLGSSTTATLMLEYSGEDITANGNLFITLLAAGHTGTGDLAAGSLPIIAGAGMNICGRTAQVRDAILADISPAATCGDVAASDLAGITDLILENRGISTLQNGDFAGLSALARLELGFNSLNTLPDNVFSGLSALVELFLSSNNLTTLPDGVFSGLTALEVLAWDNNGFTSLDADVFSGLSALVELFLHNNRLSTLPDEVFSGLTALEVLGLDINNLSELPAGVFSGLTALEVLNLDENNLATLPDGVFSGLTALEVLNLDENNLATLPDGVFSGLSNLAVLELNDNALTSLDADVFSGLSALVELRLFNNRLTSLNTNVFDGLDALEDLWLFGNPFTVDTGLPAGVFDDVLNTLGGVESDVTSLTPDDLRDGGDVMDGIISGRFFIDDAVRNAHFVCARSDADAIVAATTGVSDCLIITSAQLTTALATPPTATLAASPSLTEANLTGPATTVTVTVANTEYEDPLTAAHFMLSDTVPGVVSISGGDSGVVRDSPTQATLTLTHDGTDITMAGALTVTVQDAGHTGTGDLPTATVPITAGAGMNICGRTAQVRDAILASISFFSPPPCGDVEVSDLAGITELILFSEGISALQNGDFAGLSGLERLFLGSNSLSTLPENVFNGLSALETLDLHENNLSTLPDNVFNGLSALEALSLDENNLSELPAGIFSGLTALEVLYLDENNLATLPDGVFSGLSNLELLELDDNVLTSLDADVFSGLSALVELRLFNNRLTSLNTNVFDGLDALEDLWLFGNPFIADTGLPAGVFDDVLNTLGGVESDVTSLTLDDLRDGGDVMDGIISGRFFIDDAVRNAHFVCARSDTDAIVAATTGVSDCLRITSAQLTTALATPPTATLAASPPLTEGNLTGPTTTVTVTVANTEYEDPLTAAHFMLSDTVPGVVSISGGDSGVARDSPTQATLTLTHDGTDITMAGALTVTVQDAGHTGTGDLPAGSVPITAGAVVNICGRTAQVRDAILADISSTATCGDVAASDLAGITQLALVGSGISTLQNGDFAGLSALEELDLSINSLSTLPENVFNGLSALETLSLLNNNLSTLPENVFNGLSALAELHLDSNSLSTLPDNVFNGLSALTILDLDGNNLSTLPDNVFNGLSALVDLRLFNNNLSTLPANVFNGLSALVDLDLGSNSLSTLPDNVFNGLSALTRLNLEINSLSTLPANVFNGLSALEGLALDENNLSELPAGIFSGLTALQILYLDENNLATLPDGVFSGLSNLELLELDDNALTSLDADVFSGLSELVELRLFNNSLTSLNTNVFDGLDALEDLWLFGNPFIADTGLPAGVFDDVLNNLGGIESDVTSLTPDDLRDGGDVMDGIISGRFFIDDAVRNAHFVCSLPEAMLVVDATAGVDDCLRITASQLNTYLGVTVGVTVDPVALTVDEAGSDTTSDYTVVLDTVPTADVTIAVASSDTLAATVSSASLTFTPANWNTAQTVTVTGVNDDIDNPSDERTASLSHTATSGDTGYEGVAIDPVTVTVTDDDDAGVTVDPTALTVPEDGSATSDYTVVLDTVPTAEVTIAVASSDTLAATVSSASLTFTTTDWNTAQTVTVTGVNDDAPGDRIATVTHAPTSTDTTYNSVSIDSVTVTVEDDDTAGLTFDPVSVSVNEGGSSSYTVVLDTEPTVTVTVAITAGGDVSTNPASLTFTTTDWNTAQTVTVNAAQDSDGNNDSQTLAHAASGAEYDSVTGDVSVTVIDDDVPGVRISTTALTVPEGGPNTYTVRLNTQPGGDVVVTVNGASGDVSFSGSPLTFTTINWNTDQTVTVNAAQDDDAAPDATVTLTHGVTGYGAINSGPEVVVTVTEDDTAGLTFDPVSVSVNEGGSSSYTVVLDTEPTVTVTVAITAGGDVSTNPASLAFTTSDWNTAQTVTVNASQDVDGNNDSQTLAHAASGAEYDSVTGDVSVTVIDDDVPGVRISPTALTVPEGGPNTYTVRLNTQPGGDVVVTVGGASGDVSFSGSPLTFTTGNWDTDQTVTVNAAQDDDAAPDAMVTLTHGVTGYGSVTSGPDVVVTVAEDDEVGVTVSDGALTVFEKGGTADYTVVLRTQPTANVTITPASGDTSVATVSAALTFTATDWNTPQTVTVTGMDDGIDNPSDRTATVTHTIAGGGYGSVPVADVAVTAIDANQTLVGFGYNPDEVVLNAPTPPTVMPPSGAQTPLTYSSATSAVCTVDTDTGALMLLAVGDCIITVTASETPNFNEETVDFTVMVLPMVTLDPVAGNDIVNIAERMAGFDISGMVTAGAAVSVTLGGGSSRTATVTDTNWTLPISPNDAEITGASVAVLVTATANGNTGTVERVIGVDLVAPTLESAVVNGDTLTLLYDMPLDEGSVPSSTTYTVDVMTPGTPPTAQVHPVNTVSISGMSVTLMLFTAVTANDEVTLDYRPPGADPVQDVGGNDAAMLDDEPVTNSTFSGPTQEEAEQLQEALTSQVVQAAAAQVIASVGARIETALSGGGLPPTGGARLDGQNIAGDGEAVLLGFLQKAPEYTRSLKDGTLDWKRMLANSSFILNVNDENGAGGNLGLWGSGYYTDFDGDDNNLNWDGNSYGFQIGADTQLNPNLLTGVAASWSRGDVEYNQGRGADEQEGDYMLTLTGIHPYIGWSDDEAVWNLWANAGYAEGEVEIKPDEGRKQEHDISMISIAGGFKRALTDLFYINADFSIIETDVDASDDTNDDQSLTIGSQRFRLLLEAQSQRQLDEGGIFIRSVELGYRLDEGDSDADTNGAELGGSINYSNLSTGLTLSGEARALVGNSDYREWGISGLIRLQTGAQGLSFTLEPGYGDTAGGASELWNRRTPHQPTERNDYGARMKMHLGYGLNGFVTPYTEMTTGNDRSRYRMGVKWQLGESLDLDLFGEQHQGGGNENALRLEGELRF